MGETFLVMLREGVEAALIVAIVLAYLHRTGRREGFPWVWAGTGAATAVALVAGIVVFAVLTSLEGRAEEITEGIIAMVAAGVLTWMIFWMARQARHIKGLLHSRIDRALQAGSLFGLAGIAFVAVLREGLESALFLISTTVGSTSGAARLAGALAGVAAAVGVGYLFYRGSQWVNLRSFFRVTGILIILFAAGLLAKGVHEFQEVALFPTLGEHVWDLGSIGILNPERSTIAELLKGLFGWSPAPSVEMVAIWLLYLIPIGAAFLVTTRKLPATRSTIPTEAGARAG